VVQLVVKDVPADIDLAHGIKLQQGRASSARQFSKNA